MYDFVGTGMRGYQRNKEPARLLGGGMADVLVNRDFPDRGASMVRQHNVWNLNNSFDANVYCVQIGQIESLTHDSM